MDIYEVRKDEGNFASVLLDNTTNGKLLVSYESSWKGNAKALKKKAAQRAYFNTDKYGRKLLNLSAIMSKAQDKKSVSKLLFNEEGKFLGNEDQKFIVEFKKGNVENVYPPKKESK